MNNIFYNYIDRLLPSCFFCLEEKVKTLLTQGDVSSPHSIDAEQCPFPDNYVVIPIENAVLPFYLTCIDRKYTFLLIDRHFERCLLHYKEAESVSYEVSKTDEQTGNLRTHPDVS